MNKNEKSIYKIIILERTSLIRYKNHSKLGNRIEALCKLNYLVVLFWQLFDGNLYILSTRNYLIINKNLTFFLLIISYTWVEYSDNEWSQMIVLRMV